MAEHGEFVVFAGQSRTGVAAALLFAGQERRVGPVQGRFVGVVEGAVIVPQNGAEDVVAVAAESAGVLGGKGAAVGHEQHVRGQQSVGAEQIVLLFDGGVAVAVAVENVAVDGECAEFVDGGGEPDLEHFAVGEVAVGDVGGGKSPLPRRVACVVGGRGVECS